MADRWKTLAPQAALRGEFPRALDLYRSLAAVEPNVPLHRIRAGDCLVKMGLKREALLEYRVAADAYLALGMPVHARSAWRLVLGIVPGDADASARLLALDARVRGSGIAPGTPPPVPAPAAVIAAPPPPRNAPPVRARAATTPTSPESVFRAERASARAEPVPELVIPAISRETARIAPAAASLEKALAVTPVVARRADVRGQVEPAVTPPPTARERLALEFADLDDDDDGIWIDLEGIVDAPATAPQPLVPASDETEPVVFFAANDDDDASPSRRSGPPTRSAGIDRRRGDEARPSAGVLSFAHACGPDGPKFLTGHGR